MNEAGERSCFITGHHRNVATLDPRYKLSNLLAFDRTLVSSLDYIRLFLAARHKRARTHDCVTRNRVYEEMLHLDW